MDKKGKKKSNNNVTLSGGWEEMEREGVFGFREGELFQIEHCISRVDTCSSVHPRKESFLCLF